MMILGVTTLLLAVPPHALDARLESLAKKAGTTAHVKEFKKSGAFGGSKYAAATEIPSHLEAQAATKKKGQSAFGGHVQTKGVKKEQVVVTTVDGVTLPVGILAGSCSLGAPGLPVGPEATSIVTTAYGPVEVPSLAFDAVAVAGKPYDFRCPSATKDSCCDLTDDTGCDAAAINAQGLQSVLTNVDAFVNCYQCACPTTCSKFPTPTCADPPQCYNCALQCVDVSQAVFSTFPGTSVTTEVPQLSPPAYVASIATAGPPITNPASTLDFRCPTATIDSCCDLTDDTGCDADKIASSGGLSVLSVGGLDAFVDCYRCACPKTCEKYTTPTLPPQQECFAAGTPGLP